MRALSHRCWSLLQSERDSVKSPSNPLDKVRESHATFCGKHSAQQIDPKLFDTCCLHSKGSPLELIMDTHPSTLHPRLFCSGPMVTEYDLNSWKNLTSSSQKNNNLFFCKDNMMLPCPSKVNLYIYHEFLFWQDLFRTCVAQVIIYKKKIKYIFLVKYPGAKILFLTKHSLNDELMVGLGFIQ